jgi:hypothetical protein
VKAIKGKKEEKKKKKRDDGSDQIIRDARRQAIKYKRKETE